MDIDDSFFFYHINSGYISKNLCFGEIIILKFNYCTKAWLNFFGIIFVSDQRPRNVNVFSFIIIYCFMFNIQPHYI